MGIASFALLLVAAQDMSAPTDDALSRSGAAAASPQDGRGSHPPTWSEADAASAAIQTNALADYRRYLLRFPAGDHAERFRSIVTARVAAAADLAAYPTDGARRAFYIISPQMVMDGIDIAALRTLVPTGDAVRARWDIAEDGAVENCTALSSSGSPRLDRVTAIS